MRDDYYANDSRYVRRTNRFGESQWVLRSHLTLGYRARIAALRVVALPLYAVAVVAEAVGRLGRTR